MLPEFAPAFVPGFVGGPELLIVLLIAVLLFGANKLPKLARSVGSATGEFQKGREEVEQDIRESARPAPDGADPVAQSQSDVATESDAAER